MSKGVKRVSCSYHHTIYSETNPSCVEKKCVAETLKLIDRLQRQSLSREKENSCLRCDKPFLGHRSTANTRPVILYLKNGDPFELAYCDENTFAAHVIFRVEEVKGNCATLRMLIPLCSSCHEFEFYDANHPKYRVTKTCVTVDLNTFSAVQCLDDVELPLKGCLY